MAKNALLPENLQSSMSMIQEAIEQLPYNFVDLEMHANDLLLYLDHCEPNQWSLEKLLKYAPYVDSETRIVFDVDFSSYCINDCFLDKE